MTAAVAPVQATGALECYDCSRPLHVVWRLPVRQENGGAPYVPLCAGCAEEKAPDYDWSPVEGCEHCGVGVRRHRLAVGSRVTCSPRCYELARSAARKAMRQSPRRSCDWCGEGFQPQGVHYACSDRCRKAKWKSEQAINRDLPQDAQRAERCRCSRPLINSADDPDLCMACGKYLPGRWGLVAA
jgi:hypothetical protein